MPFHAKETFTEFKKDPKVSQWIKGLHPNSVSGYGSALFAICTGLELTGTEFLEEAEANPKALSIKVKSLIKSLNGSFSQITLGYRIAAMNNFLDFHEIERLPLAGLKIKRARPAVHPLLKWEDAERIISLAPEAYQPVYRLMLWGLDAERFIQLNQDRLRLKAIEQQLEDPHRDLVKITVNGRKSNANPYYLLVPRTVASYLPVRKVKGQPIIGTHNIQAGWRTALLRAGLPFDKTHGAHNLRSCWLTEATRRGLDPVLREFQLGHQVDGLNYQRVMQDEVWVLEQHRKAWQIQPAATKQELKVLQEENKLLKDTLIQQLVDRLTVLSYEGENTPEGEKLRRLRDEETRLMERLTDLGLKMDGYPTIVAKPATPKP
ncbi:MAG: hypothetical protein ABSD99_00170 [Candidatus Bathyarchaeia archaeon]|jgi:hypothetical protein